MTGMDTPCGGTSCACVMRVPSSSADVARGVVSVFSHALFSYTGAGGSLINERLGKNPLFFGLLFPSFSTCDVLSVVSGEVDELDHSVSLTISPKTSVSSFSLS